MTERPTMTSWRGLIQDSYIKVGLLAPLVVVGFAAALVTHHESPNLPSSYTWDSVWDVIKNVLTKPHMPSLVLLAYALGRLRRRGEWKISRRVSALFEKIDLAPYRRRILKVLLFALTFAVLDLSLFHDHDWLDSCSAALLGGVLGAQRMDWRRIVYFLSHVAAVLLIFVVVSYTFTIFKALLFVGRDPLDAGIIEFERGLFGVNPHRLIAAWVADHPGYVSVAHHIYLYLFDHMTLVSVFLIGARLARERTEFISALAICYLVGGLLYYVYPGIGPTFWEFDTHRYVLGTEVEPLRTLLFQATSRAVEGNLQTIPTYTFIACMPSLHMAHEFVMLWYARHSRLALLLSIVFTFATFLAIQALGWHYAIDTLFGGLVAASVIALCRWQRDVLLPAALMRVGDSPLPPRPRLGAWLRQLKAARAPAGHST